MSQTFHASAPGKLVIVGEYAVVYGAPALVSAVPRRATVSLTCRSDDNWLVRAPGLNANAHKAPMTFSGITDPALGSQLPLLASVIRSLAFQGPGCNAELDTQAFYTDRTAEPLHPSRPSKLGLGSSSAMCTAMMGALALIQRPQTSLDKYDEGSDQLPVTLAEVLKAHQLFQQGKGSGIDIAASYLGGCVEFRRQPSSVREISHSRSALPVLAVWVWSGKSAATTSRLQRLQQFAQSQPDLFGSLMGTLSGLTKQACEGAKRHDGDAFLDATRDFSQCLEDLDQRSSLGVWTDDHRKIAYIAKQCGVFYKTSGAGGGDCGLALDKDRGKLEYFLASALRAGYSGWHLGAENQGLKAD